jgi:hypothetical protein
MRTIKILGGYRLELPSDERRPAELARNRAVPLRDSIERSVDGISKADLPAVQSLRSYIHTGAAGQHRSRVGNAGGLKADQMSCKILDWRRCGIVRTPDFLTLSIDIRSEHQSLGLRLFG